MRATILGVLVLLGCSESRPTLPTDTMAGGDRAGGGDRSTAVDLARADRRVVDAAVVDARRGEGTKPSFDKSGPIDVSMPQFPALMEGTWLIGWSGGMNHYSWVRLSGATGSGTAEFLAGDTLTVNTPYWACSGKGTWMMTAKPYTIGLYFPSSCTLGFWSATFSSFQVPGGYPKGAVLSASVQPLATPPPALAIEGYKFPPSQCDAAMTTCTDPLK